MHDKIIKKPQKPGSVKIRDWDKKKNLGNRSCVDINALFEFQMPFCNSVHFSGMGIL